MVAKGTVPKMFSSIIQTIEKVLLPYGAKGVFVGALIEEIIAPIPSTLVMMGAGFFLINNVAGLADLSKKIFLNVSLPAALGITLSSLLVYALAYWFGKPLLERYGKFLGLTWQDVEKAEQKFTKGYADELILFLIRAVPIIPNVAINVFCGLVHLPLRKYIIFTFLGSLVRASILGFLGWQLGALYHATAKFIDRFEDIILLLLIAAAAGFVVYRRSRSRPAL